MNQEQPPQQQQIDTAEEKIWLPGPHNFLIAINDSYFHSLWLGTVALFMSLPVSLGLHVLLPILQSIGYGVMGILTIIWNVFFTITTTLGSQTYRIAKLFLYGVFGYLNTISTDRLKAMVTAAQQEMLRVLTQEQAQHEARAGMHQKD